MRRFWLVLTSLCWLWLAGSVAAEDTKLILVGGATGRQGNAVVDLEGLPKPDGSDSAAIEARVPGSVDHAHAATPELAAQLVVPKHARDLELGRGLGRGVEGAER